jgi:ribosomal-protein-alanine N-acetyltransferase
MNEPWCKQKNTPAAESAARIRSIVRRYLPEDREKVMAIAAASPEAARWSAASYDRDESSGQTVFVAEVDDCVCGFLVFRHAGGEAEVLNLAVDSANRRQGVGKSLLEAALASLPADEAIFLEVRESNWAGVAFYEAQGFSVVGKRTGYYRDPEENALLMRKKITG